LSPFKRPCNSDKDLRCIPRSLSLTASRFCRSFSTTSRACREHHSKFTHRFGAVDTNNTKSRTELSLSRSCSVACKVVASFAWFCRKFFSASRCLHRATWSWRVGEDNCNNIVLVLFRFPQLCFGCAVMCLLNLLARSP